MAVMPRARHGPFLASVLVLCATVMTAGAEPRLVTFSPRGTVKDVRQVTAAFSDPMVPLGDPRPATDVFDVACAGPGARPGVDNRRWSYDVPHELPAAL